jgi:ATP-dependent DNA helicase DinG
MEQKASALLKGVLSVTPGTEPRETQLALADAIGSAMVTGEHLLAQAGTGTGKTLAYLCAAVAERKTVVVSTATKQLGDQLSNKDTPNLGAALKEMNHPHIPTVALLKGRANYVCLKKVQDARNDTKNENLATGSDTETVPAAVETVELFSAPTVITSGNKTFHPAAGKPTGEDFDGFRQLLPWVDVTRTGDRVDAPPVTDWAWRQVSTDAAGCIGADCPFVSDCFSETARKRVRTADIAITNHALLAHDLNNPDGLFANKNVIIADEAHELERYLSDAWGVELSARSIEDALTEGRKCGTKTVQDDITKDTIVTVLQTFEGLTAAVPEGELNDSDLAPFAECFTLIEGYTVALTAGLDKNNKDEVRTKTAGGKLESLLETIRAVKRIDPYTVKWFDTRGGQGFTFRTAPLRVGPAFQTALGDRTFVAVSATLALGSDFTNTARTFGLTEPNVTLTPPAWSSYDAGTPFDYTKQALLFIPDESFPVPAGASRAAHAEAVNKFLLRAVQTAGGRTLFLSTTVTGAKTAGAYLREHGVTVPVLIHGEHPADVLAQQFRGDERSVLCATLGMWAGLDVPGNACIAVVIDKINFPMMTDALANARKRNADNEGRNGFHEVFVTHAGLTLAQGAGRLIRRGTDKGLIAVMDNRIITKSYGRSLLKTLPQTGRVWDDETVVLAALGRLAAIADTAFAAGAPTELAGVAKLTPPNTPPGPPVIRETPVRTVKGKQPARKPARRRATPHAG